MRHPWTKGGGSHLSEPQRRGYTTAQDTSATSDLLSDLGSHHVLVDSVGWEGRRDELAETVASWLDLPTSRVRATLAVRDQPVATFDDAAAAQALVASLAKLGVRARVRTGVRRSLADLTRRRVEQDTHDTPIADETQQPGWSAAFGPAGATRGVAHQATVAGMPGATHPAEMERTLIASPDAAVRFPGVPTSEPPLEDSKPSLRRTPTGAQSAVVRSRPDAVAAAPPSAASVSAHGWSDVLGSALQERLVADSAAPAAHPEPARMPPSALAAGADTIVPQAAKAARPASRETSNLPGLRETMVHEPPVARELAEPSASLPPTPADPASSPASPPPKAFVRLRQDDEAALLPAPPAPSMPMIPSEKAALLWGIAAPGAGQAYLGDMNSALTHALGGVLIWPWIRGARDAAGRVRRMQSGHTLPVRSPNLRRTAGFVACWWGTLAMLALGWVLLRESVEPATLPAIDHAALEARARANVEAERARIAAIAAEEARAAEEAEAVASAERAQQLEGLLQAAREACDAGRFEACRARAQLALELDGTSRRARMLHAEALNEGRVLPEADAAEPTDPVSP